MKKILENKKKRNIFIAIAVLVLFILTNVIYFAVTTKTDPKKMSDEELLTYCLDLNDDELVEFLTSIEKSDATRAMNLINSYQIIEAMNEDSFDEKRDEASVKEAVDVLNDVKEYVESNDNNNNSDNDNEISDEMFQKMIDDGIIVPLDEVDE